MTQSAHAGFIAETPTDLIQFFERWSELPRNGLVPRLADYLDTALPQLQPTVTIVNVHGPREMTVRLFGTALENSSGQYPTTRDLMTLYAEPVRDLARRVVWSTVTHPTGYTCIRHVRTTGGEVLECPAIGLPILLDTPEPRCFITYANIDNLQPAIARREGLAVVQDIQFIQWLDLGAGTPADPP